MPFEGEYLLADLYDVWVNTAPAAALGLPFYVEEYVRTPGPVVELGVGNGRIAIEAARRGRDIIGVDSSSAMLEQCRVRARAAGVEHRLTLIQADFRAFALPVPALLIAIPFNTFGHLLTPEDQRAALRQIHSQLAPQGRLIFDQFVFDPELARGHHGVPQLRAEYTDPVSGRDALLWTTALHDLPRQRIRVLVCTELLETNGIPIERRYRRLDLQWFRPEEVRGLLEETGFTVETVFGNFDRHPMDETSRMQIWVTRRT